MPSLSQSGTIDAICVSDQTISRCPARAKTEPARASAVARALVDLGLGVEAKDEARGAVRVRSRAGARDGVRGRSI